MVPAPDAPMLVADVKKHCPAYCIKSLFSIIVFCPWAYSDQAIQPPVPPVPFPAGDTAPHTGFYSQTHGAHGCGVCPHPDAAPVQNVDMGTKAPFKLLVKFADNECQSTWWNGFFYGANLVDTFLWAGLVIFQQIILQCGCARCAGFLCSGHLWAST